MDIVKYYDEYFDDMMSRLIIDGIGKQVREFCSKPLSNEEQLCLYLYTDDELDSFWKAFQTQTRYSVFDVHVCNIQDKKNISKPKQDYINYHRNRENFEKGCKYIVSIFDL